MKIRKKETEEKKFSSRKSNKSEILFTITASNIDQPEEERENILNSTFACSQIPDLKKLVW